MNIRRLLLSLTLSIGVAPAFAQAPPPVPALPDTARQTSYTLASSTCACAVGFALYGDSTDYQNWLEVYVSGVKVSFNDPTFGWVVSSPTGPLSSIPRPISDAILTFNSAQSGTVTIIGSRRPRRVSQFSENRGVAARDLNQTVTDLTAESREAWDKLQGALVGQPGETILRMPAKATRANQVLAFNSNGDPTVVSVPATIPSGQVSGPGAATVGDLATWGNTLGTSLVDTPVLGAAHGGTGSASNTAHAVMLGQGASAMTTAPIGTGGAILIDQGAGNDPSFKVPSGDVSVNAAGVFSLSFLQTQGSGGISQKPSAKLLGAELYPDDYGAVDRSGVTDMGTLINTTIANAKTCAAAATAGNDVIRLRAGTYNITTPIVPKSCVTILGDGRGKTILLTNHATPLLQASGSQLVHFNLRGVTFKDSGSHPSATAMTFQVLQGSRIENIGFHGYTTGTTMNLSSNAVAVSSFDDSSGVWNSSNSFFNTFEDWVEDDSMATGLIIAGSLATPCSTATATNVVTLNTFKDIQLWGITGVGWDLVRAADSNQFIGNNIIRLIGTGGGVITPHASFKNIAVQLGDDNATCSGNNDVALERMMLTVSMGTPATGFVMFNAGNGTFGHMIDFQTDQPTSANAGFTSMAGVTGVCYGINGRNYTSTLDDGSGNLFELELDQCKYRAIMDGTTTRPAMVFSSDLGNGVYRPGAGIWAWGKGTTTLEMDGATSGQAKINVPAVAGTPTLTLPTLSGTFLTQTPGTPTIASGACGTGSNGTIAGSNMSGIVTIGAAATTTCTVGFSATLPAAPGACVIFPGNAAAAAQGTTVARVGTPSATQWVITGTALASTVYSYVCL